MNPRILKKLCKRASWYLRKLQLVRGEIVRDECRDEVSMPFPIAEHHISARYYENSVHMETLKGTEFCNWRCSYEYDEYEYEPTYMTLHARYCDEMHDWENFHGGDDEWPPKWIGPARIFPSHVFAWAEAELVQRSLEKVAHA